MLSEQYPGRVRGLYMCNWTSTAKCVEGEWNEVQKICSMIGIPSLRVNFEKDYWTDVFEPMLKYYSQGLTPNPDVSCNRYIKFGSLVDHLNKLHNFSKEEKDDWWLATGHYARIAEAEENSSTPDHLALMRPKDRGKDQSYYLSTIKPGVLNRVFFPLADYTKKEVRAMAESRFALGATASKPDSQGLCFVSQDQNTFREFLNDYVNPEPGKIVTTNGEVVGEHMGLWHATIGQRSGVSLPQGSPAYKGVWYVCDKNIARNEIVICRGVDNPALYMKGATSGDFEWLVTDIHEAIDPSNLYAQYRSLQDPCKVVNFDVSGPSNKHVSVTFDTPTRAIAPGQYLVLYSGDRVLGSGMVNNVIR